MGQVAKSETKGKEQISSTNYEKAKEGPKQSPRADCGAAIQHLAANTGSEVVAARRVRPSVTPSAKKKPTRVNLHKKAAHGHVHAGMGLTFQESQEII